MNSALEHEVWLPIPGYEGYYEVSNLGRIKSLKRKVYNPHGNGSVKERILCQHMDNNGYLKVGLNKDGTNKVYNAHRLVASAFLPNPNNYPCINHKNEDRRDNRVDNLEWCTYIYNNHYGDRLKKVSVSSGQEVIQLDPGTGKEVNRFHSTREARRQTGIYHIDACCRGEREIAGGYKWQYGITQKVYEFSA